MGASYEWLSDQKSHTDISDLSVFDKTFTEDKLFSHNKYTGEYEPVESRTGIYLDIPEEQRYEFKAPVSKKYKLVNHVELFDKYIKTYILICLQKSVSIQPRTRPEEFGLPTPDNPPRSDKTATTTELCRSSSALETTASPPTAQSARRGGRCASRRRVQPPSAWPVSLKRLLLRSEVNNFE